MFYRFLLVFGGQLGAMLATFSTKMGQPCGDPPPFCWVYVIFRFFGRPGPLLAPFWLDFGGFGAPFWRFLGSILDVSGWGWAGGVTRSAKNFENCTKHQECSKSMRNLEDNLKCSNMQKLERFNPTAYGKSFRALR